MGATITTTMTVAQARQLLRDTSSLPPERVDAAQRAISAFHDAKPRHQCPACRAMVWSEHVSDGDAIWACAGCHRPSTLTAEEWHAQRSAAEAVRKGTAAREAAGTPDLHAVLQDALAARVAANAEVMKLDRAVPAARAAVVEAQVRHDRAVENAEAVNAHSAANLAETFYTGTKPPDSARTAAAARGELSASTDALVVARNAKVILDSKVEAARSALGFANDRARKAAHGVLAADMLEGLLGEAAEARANYLESVGQLGWLLRNRAIPNGDARARQLLGEANTPPSTWREAATAGTAQMEDALAALLADPIK